MPPTIEEPPPKVALRRSSWSVEILYMWSSEIIAYET